MTESPTLNIENPWPGLLAFREADQNFFAGRRAETESLFRIVMRERLTVLFGLSGLGKSSILQAGLFPLLRREGIFPIYIRLDFSAPNPDLIGQVTAAIARASADADIEAPAARLDDSLWEYLHRTDNDFWTRRNRPVLPLLVFDQFEEIFTLGRGGQRLPATEALIDQLADIAEGRPPARLKAAVDANPEAAKAFSFTRHDYKILLSIREDFLPELEMLRPRAPSIALNRFRLQRMNGEAALEAVSLSPHLVSRDVAERIVRFVAAAAEGSEPLLALEVEPALLSVICRELNERRKTAGESRITSAVLEGSHEQVLTEFYERSMADLAPSVRSFVEDDLLTPSGYRDSVALENALSRTGVTRDAVDALVARRLVRREDRGGVERLELTHDLLCGVVRASRDRRQLAEAAEGERRKARIALEEARERETQERNRRDLRRIKTAAAVFLLMTLAAVGAAAWALQLRSAAERSRKEAETASQKATVEQKRAEDALQRISRGLLIRQAALSGDDAKLDQLLASLDRNSGIRFRTRASDLRYKNPAGQDVYKFEVYPDRATLPAGEEAVAFVTYLADHPTFQNTLMTAGQDRGFLASYIGWGCLRRIVALIEYKDPAHPPAVAEFDMCQQLGW